MSARSGNIESLQRLNRMNRPSKSLVTPPPPKRSNGIARQPNAAPRLASLRYSRHQLVVFALEKAIGWLRNCANTRNQPTLTTVSCNSPIEFPPEGSVLSPRTSPLSRLSLPCFSSFLSFAFRVCASVEAGGDRRRVFSFYLSGKPCRQL